MRAFAFALMLCLAPGVGRGEDCRLALLLAVDVSSSVDTVEYSLQTKGLAAALVSPDVTRAFMASPAPVALAVYEWSGRYNQVTVQDWVLVKRPAHLLAIAETIAAHPRSHSKFPTAMGYALGHAVSMMRRAPPCAAYTLDISGDGKNNEGFGPDQAYRAFAFEGITVNGLAINGADYEAETDLIPYYRNEVLRGPGAFLEIAQGFEDFERAMQRKLEREVAPGFVGGLPAPLPPRGEGLAHVPFRQSHVHSLKPQTRIGSGPSFDSARANRTN